MIDKKISTSLQHWPCESLEILSNCPVCGYSKSKLLYKDLVDKIYFCAPGRWQLLKCACCGSAYLNPRPKENVISLTYAQYYTHQSYKRQETAELNFIRKLIRALANGYRNYKLKSRLEPSLKLGGVIFYFVPIYRARIDLELRFLGRIGPNARLLDVGCGNGSFLMLAKELGWHVYGCDPDPKAVNVALRTGAEVRIGGIEVYQDLEGKFDVITMSHVIEHVHDPRKVIAIAYKLLKPGGILYIDTPNLNSRGHREFKENWRGLDVPRHLVVLTWKAVETLLVLTGFSKIVRLTSKRGISYPLFGAQSRAIRDGRDPYKDANITIIDWIKGIFNYYISLIDNDQSEFITLFAIKEK